MDQEKRWLLLGILLLMVILMLTGWVGEMQAQPKYPTRPIDIIVPFVPGGSADSSARVIVFYLNKKWGVPVNVVNKPGGNTIPGCLEVYSANPDGYTLLLDGTSNSYMLAVAVKNLPFKIMDRTFIGSATGSPHLIGVPSASPFKSLKELEVEAKRDPESFTWTSQGGVGGQDYVMRQFFKAIGVDVTRTKPVMGAGGGAAAIMTAGGHVKIGVFSTSAALPPVKAGTIRPLAVTDKVRNSDFPDVPTAAEVGYPTVDVVAWYGISGPPKLPSYIVDIWDKALQEMTKDPEVISKWKNVGVTPFYLNANATIEHVKKKTEEVEILWGLK